MLWARKSNLAVPRDVWGYGHTPQFSCYSGGSCSAASNFPPLTIHCGDGGAKRSRRSSSTRADSFNITFIRNYALTTNETDLSYPIRPDWADSPWAFILPWVHRIRRDDISIVVLNRGAHYVPDRQLYTELNETFSYLTRHFPDVTVIYRDSPSGHPGCRMDFNVTPRAKATLNYASEDYNWKYNWHNFDSQNTLTKKLIETHYPHIVFMDVSHMTSRRPDGHSDCLHYCIPGPIDAWVVNFVEVLDILDRHTRLVGPNCNFSKGDRTSNEAQMQSDVINFDIKSNDGSDVMWSNVDPRSVYYNATQQTLLAYLYHVETIWKTIVPYNRTLIVPPVRSQALATVKDPSFCLSAIMVTPPSLVCSSRLAPALSGEGRLST
jgi:hypothetical protein